MEKEIMYNTDKKQVTASTFPAQLSMKFGQLRFTPRIMLYSNAATKIGSSIPTSILLGVFTTLNLRQHPAPVKSTKYNEIYKRNKES